MSDEELEAYIKTIEPNFYSHLEKGTIEMSNEYFNLLEERMARLINENQKLKAKIKTYEDPNDLTLMFMYCDEKAKDKIRELKKQLEEKNKPQIFIDTQDMEERYAEGLYQDYLEEENQKYKEVIDKAIEYINEMFNTGFYNDDYYLGHLNQILQDKEVE